MGKYSWPQDKFEYSLWVKADPLSKRLKYETGGDSLRITMQDKRKTCVVVISNIQLGHAQSSERWRSLVAYNIKMLRRYHRVRP